MRTSPSATPRPASASLGSSVAPRNGSTAIAIDDASAVSNGAAAGIAPAADGSGSSPVAAHPDARRQRIVGAPVPLPYAFDELGLFYEPVPLGDEKPQRIERLRAERHLVRAAPELESPLIDD